MSDDKRDLTQDEHDLMIRALIDFREKIADIPDAMSDDSWQPIETAPKDGSWVLVWERYIDQPCPHPNAKVWFYRDDVTFMRCEDCGSRWLPPAPPAEG